MGSVFEVFMSWLIYIFVYIMNEVGVFFIPLADSVYALLKEMRCV